MDLIKQHLNDCSPYILNLNYNLNQREIVVVFANNTEDWAPSKRLVFSDVISFSEEPSEDLNDDDLIDSLMDLHIISKGKYCLNTEKRELIFQTKNPLFSEYLK